MTDRTERYDGGPGVRTVGGPAVRTVRQQSTGELVQRASEQFSRLVRDEMTLARAELTEKGRHAGRGAGLLGGGGLVALYGFGALVLAAIFGLAVVWPAWLSALVVGAALLVVAAILAAAGGLQVRQAGPPMPERTVRSVRDDLDVVTGAVRSRGRR